MAYRDRVEDSKPATIRDVHDAISTLDKHLVSEFNWQYKFHQDIIKETRHNIEVLNRTVEALNKEVQALNQEVNKGFQNSRGSIDGILAVSRNRLAIRPYAQITKYPTKENEIPTHFPKTVSIFWSLQEPSNLFKLASLLDSYVYDDYTAWAEFDEFGEPVDQTELHTYPGDDNPLTHYVERYPEKAHRALANILGLEYDSIRQEVEKVRRYIAEAQAAASGTNKRGSTEGGARRKSQKTVSDNSSLTEEIHRGELGDYKQACLSSTPSDEKGLDL